MYRFIIRKLNIDRREVTFSFFMFITSGILGVFLSTFDIVTHAIFLEKFNQNDLTLAYLFSGVLGIIMFFIYSQAFKRLSVKVFNFINLFIILAATSIYFYFFFFWDTLWAGFFGLVVMFPVNLLALLNFWRYLRKVLHPHQMRRLYPKVEFGFILGMITGSFLVTGVLLRYDYYIISAITLAAVIFLFLIQFPVNIIHSRRRVFNHKRDKFVPVRRSFLLIFSSRYTTNLFLFALFSSVICYLIHFVFINLARESYPHVVGMSKFYGVFMGVTYILIFFVSRFFIRKVLYSYDSPYSLILMPVALFFILIVTYLSNLAVDKWLGLEDRLFIMVIVVVYGLNKIAYDISRYVIQFPSQRTLYRTLDIRFLQVIIPRIEGTVVMLGIFLAGAIILGLLNLRIYSISVVLLTVLLISPLWFISGVKLIKAYKNALQESYKKLRIGRTAELHFESYNEKIRKILVGDDPVKVINAMKISSKIEPLSYEKSLRRMLANPEPAIQNYVLQCIQEETIIDLLPDLKEIKPAEEKTADLLSKIISEFERRESMLKRGTDLESLLTSRNVKDRIHAAELIGARKDTTYTAALINLSREFEPDVKIAAVKAMARMSSTDHSYVLIEFLNSPQYHAYAFEALIEIGEPALEYLERLFLNPGTDDRILSQAIRIYGKIGTAKAIDLLLNKLENQSRKVSHQVVIALHEAQFQASSLNVHRILNVMVRAISVLGWNFLISTSLPNKKKYNDLSKAYHKEIKMNYDIIYNLLSLAYNSRTVREIRELVDNGDQADISHAIEMLDHFVLEDIKPVLFPIIENISDKERVKRLQYYFPIEAMSEEEMIASTLVRDYNLLSIYPRVCSMQLALELPELEVSQELIANLFHPNKMLREVAATVVFKKDPELFESVIQRIDPDIQYELKDTLMAVEKGDRMLTIDNFAVLQNTYQVSELDEDILIEFSGSLHERKYLKGEKINFETQIDDFALFLIVKGGAKSGDMEIKTMQRTQYQLYYSKMLVNNGITGIEFTEDSVLLCIDEETINSLIYEYSEMASCVLSCVEQFKLAG
ncbi:MAG: HEAT repeat domain-containing protein [Bacteroidales bacterium]|nr:HEAT repeat domain-containing protein [Bacteroidales bacterium]